ncbi:hypothetical protein Rsub_02943 [Raphidocelis subcapitata]|uniref:Uncharacterized protein n=1 Tax=Raphidocelis subcapitata TaxID=307507 RepID=A0A2V0NW40_9CHLO|nr:hypothetical protein Rsub_02943 [Raphidocelis subcapitata]|eukprot:GBF89773.1 hypothetical protein Rsub_02943 [Raphidocelis subcapitata]
MGLDESWKQFAGKAGVEGIVEGAEARAAMLAALAAATAAAPCLAAIDASMLWYASGTPKPNDFAQVVQEFLASLAPGLPPHTAIASKITQEISEIVAGASATS